MINIAVVIYRPREGNYHHWALHVYYRQTRSHCIFQTEGDPNELQPSVRNCRPEVFDRLLKRIVIGDIPEQLYGRLLEIISSVRMQNEISSWDCPLN